MEGFWEGLIDILIILVKATIALAAIRLLLFAFGFKVYVPFVDEFLLMVLDFLRPV